MVDSLTLGNMERDVRSGDKNLMKAYQAPLLELAQKHGGSSALISDIKQGEKNILANASHENEIKQILSKERAGASAAPATAPAPAGLPATEPEPESPASSTPATDADVDLDSADDAPDAVDSSGEPTGE